VDMVFEEIYSSLDTYKFRPIKVPLITKYLLDSISNMEGLVKISLDLGKTYINTSIIGGKLFFDGYEYDLVKIYGDVEYDKIYILVGGKIGPVAFFRDGLYYKLYPISSYDAPTLEISGVKMHRVVGITPWQDSRLKVSRVKVGRGDKVLDICTGLGYTAINSFYRGGTVISIEKDINVLNIARYNPWSRGLENIPILLGDAYEIVGDLPREFFDVIIHDPPRFALAGELYSLDFYRKLYSVLRRGGRLFHYVGEPGIKKGKYLIGGVAKRLRMVGFTVRIDRSLKGVYAQKF